MTPFPPTPGQALGLLQRLIRSRQFRSYVVVGVLTNGLNLALYAWLEAMVGVPYLAASAISTALSLGANYSLHRWLTFRAHETTTRSSASRFVVLAGFNYVAEQVILFVLVDYLGVGAWIAKALVLGAIIAYNFLALRFLVFSHRPSDVPGNVPA